MDSSKSKSNKTETSQSKRSVVNNGKTNRNSPEEEVRDQYVVPSDYIWRDCILHERKSTEMWRQTWNWFEQFDPTLHKPRQKIPGSLALDDSKDILYKKSSGMYFDDTYISSKTKYFISKNMVEDKIGIHLRRQSFPFGDDIVNGKIYFAPPKIRFTQEQYGYYRMKKYLNDTSFNEESKYPVTRFVRHDVYPLLC